MLKNKSAGGIFMKRIMMVLSLVILLAGCSSELLFTEVNMNHVNKDVTEFMNDVQGENGAYLYHDNKWDMYIFLNGINVVQGSKALHFTDANIATDGDTLKIYFQHDSTDDYSDQSLNFQQLYKLTLDKTYDKIMIFDNDEETSFQGIVLGD